ECSEHDYRGVAARSVDAYIERDRGSDSSNRATTIVEDRSTRRRVAGRCREIALLDLLAVSSSSDPADRSRCLAAYPPARSGRTRLATVSRGHQDLETGHRPKTPHTARVETLHEPPALPGHAPAAAGGGDDA